MRTVVLAGALANKHTWGGSAWVRMSWAEALHELGYDVVFVEQINSADCVDQRGSPAPFATSANARAFAEVMSKFGLADRSALVCADEGGTVGLSLDELSALIDTSTLLINLSGHLRMPELIGRASCRAFIDLDPAYTQIWHAEGLDGANLQGHDLHCSVGVNVGRPGWELPTGGVDWLAIRQPVVLERWPVSPRHLDFRGFSTVASWRGCFGPLNWGGQTYGVKAHSFRRFADMPGHIDHEFSVVLDIDSADGGDRRRLKDAGWNVMAPAATSGIESFRQFVLSSGAEFSVAQDAYVRSHSGWFSDRTVRYLASGRPALVQDTGFSEHLPVGAGLIAFDDFDQAVAGAKAIAHDYPRHCAAAREMAERYFAPLPALRPLLKAAGLLR